MPLLMYDSSNTSHELVRSGSTSESYADRRVSRTLHFITASRKKGDNRSAVTVGRHGAVLPVQQISIIPFNVCCA